MSGSAAARARGRGAAVAAAAALLALAACTSTGGGTAGHEPDLTGNSLAPLSYFDYPPVDLAAVSLQPEGITVESSWVLDLYTLFHSRDYRAFRILLPDGDGKERIGHLLIPPGDGPHPGVVAFEILDGPHDVSEGLAKALVNRGYAVARLERRALDLDRQNQPEAVRDALREGVIDARRLLDWLVTHPRIDSSRLFAAGVSLGSIQALLLTASDPRIRGGFYVMTGGDLAQILYDSSERAVRRFRDRMSEAHGWRTREEFLAAVRPITTPVDPLTYARYLSSDRLMLASGRFDTVMPSERTQQLHEALGRPRWYKLPCGHYTLFPFFWWTMARGADHLDRLLASLPPT